jgi:hypothetical protein
MTVLLFTTRRPVDGYSLGTIVQMQVLLSLLSLLHDLPFAAPDWLLLCDMMKCVSENQI